MGEAKRRQAALQELRRIPAVLKLPDVTLVAIDTLYYDLTRLAVQDSMRGIEFGAVLVFSDKDIAPDGATWVPCRNLNDSTYYEPYSQVLWYDVPKLVQTSHFLVCQWDGWIINPQAWEPAWLNYDYIGSPLKAWNGQPLVGNGGFSLRSAKLARHVAENTQSCPLIANAVVDGKDVCHEDILLSEIFRRRLEAAGFKWADKGAASRFAFDRIITRNQMTFGFHGYGNFPRVLTERRLDERTALINRQDVLSDISSTRNLVGLDGREYGYMATA
jgi:Protein of unknown function (DUF5672)